jgi:hypothetical protein
LALLKIIAAEKSAKWAWKMHLVNNFQIIPMITLNFVFSDGMRLIYILSLILSVTIGESQGGFRSRIYPSGSANNSTRAIFEIPGNKYIALGFLMDTINGVQHHRLTVMGLDSSGKMVWIKKYGSDNFFYYNNDFVIKTCYKQGNFLYYAGCAKDSTNKQIGVLMKFDLNGDTVWQKIYRDPDPLEDVIPQMVTGSVDGGFLITGFFQSWDQVSPYRKCLIIKTDAQGNELWRKKIGKAAPDVQDGKVILQDAASKRIIVVGYLYKGMNGNNYGHYDNVLILDSLGNKISQASYNGYGGTLVDLIQTKDGNFVAVGASFYKPLPGEFEKQQSFIIKIDLDAFLLQPVWKVTNIDPLGYSNGFTCVSELPNGDLMVGGYLDTTTNQPTNVLTKWFWINSSGKTLRKKYCNYKSNPEWLVNNQGVLSLALTSDGGWVAAIGQYNAEKPNPFIFVKYDSTGCDSTEDYCKVMNEVGLKETVKINDYYYLYPNPANDHLELSSTALKHKNLKYMIYNSIGSLICEEEVQVEEHLSIEVHNFKSGVYYLKLRTQEGIFVTKKFVIAR